MINIYIIDNTIKHYHTHMLHSKKRKQCITLQSKNLNFAKFSQWEDKLKHKHWCTCDLANKTTSIHFQDSGVTECSLHTRALLVNVAGCTSYDMVYEWNVLNVMYPLTNPWNGNYKNSNSKHSSNFESIVTFTSSLRQQQSNCKLQEDQMLKWPIFTILIGLLCRHLPYITNHRKSFNCFMPQYKMFAHILAFLWPSMKVKVIQICIEL